MIAERASVCPLDCPDTCSLTVTVEQELIVKVRGSSPVAFDSSYLPLPSVL